MASNEDWPHVGDDKRPNVLINGYEAVVTPKQLAKARQHGYVTLCNDGVERILTNMDGATVLTKFRVDRS